MGKVIKIMLSFLSALILVSILLPITLSLLLNLQVVQDYVGRQAAGWLSRKMETKVQLEKLHLKLFNRVTISGLYLEDYHQDTLFYADRIAVPVRSLNLFTGQVVLGEVELDRPKFYLMQDSTGTTNLKQILLKLKRDKPKEKKAPFRLRASGLAIRGMSFKHLKRERIDRDGVNFTDLDVEDFNLRVHHVAVIDDSIHLDIDSLRLREKSGLVINNLSTGHFAISGSMMHFDRLSLDTPDSRVEMNYFEMQYGPKWQALKDFVQQVELRGDIVDSKVSFRTIGYFAPSLKKWETVFEHVTGQVQGTVADMTGNLSRVKTRDTEISVAFGLHGIPDIPRTRFVFDVASLKTSEPDVAFLLKDITGRELDAGTTRMLSRLGPISFAGHFDGLLTDFKTDGRLRGDPGEVEMRATIRPQPDRGTAFSGHVYTSQFDVGSWLEVEKLGRLSLHTDLNGTFGSNSLTVDTNAEVPDLEFNGYTYRGIRLGGRIDNRKFVGDISSPDPNMTFDFDGQLDFNDSIPKYDFNLQLYNADLHKLGFNRRDSVSQLKTALVARASGTNLDDINGEATVSNMTYVNHLDTVRTGTIRLRAENNPRRKLLSMHSAFADAEFRGKLSYNNMFSYFQNTLRSYLPSLSRPEEAALAEGELAGAESAEPSVPSAATVTGPGGGTTSLDDYYVIRLDVKEANNVAGIFVPGLRLAEGTKLSFLFNPQSDVFNLSLTSDFIERNNFFVSKLSLNSRNQADSISLFLQSEDIFAGGIYMPNFSVVGGIKENNINVASRFNNPDNGMYAMLSTSSRLSTGPGGIPRLSIHFFPSTIVSGGQTWRVYAREILYDSTRLVVDRFSIDSGGQHLLLDGVASRSSADTLRLRLNHFDLSTFSQLTSRLGYRIKGYTNGRAEMVSALKDGFLSADIRFDSMQVNDVPLPDAVFESSWDFQQQRARFSLFRRQGRDTLMYGYFRPTDGRYLAHATLDGIDLSLLDPVLSGVIRDTRGRARADLQLTNPDKKLRINGRIRVDSLATVVDFTRVPYSVAPAEIEVRDNVMSLRQATVSDQQGHTGGLDITFDFSHFANLKYDVRVSPENMQVLGTTFQDNDLFYGTVYASGSAVIQGSKNNVSMNINATTAGNSHFYMPLSSENTISRADFIVFREEGRARMADTVQISRRKQLLLEQQRRASRRQASSARMNIRMGLDVLPNTEVQLVIDPASGDILKGRGNGHLSLAVNPSSNEFTINGDYNITEGNMRFSLQNLVARNFTLQSGSVIQFTGDPLDALLDVTAKYSLKASLAPLQVASSTANVTNGTVPVDCLIHMSGRLTDPQLTFDVQVPNASVEVQSQVAYALNSQEAMATQFLWLLATKSFNSDNDPKIGTRSAAGAGVDFLTNQLSSLLTTERFSFVPKYTPGNDYYSDEVGGSVYGELIKDRLIFEADMSYSTEKNKFNSNNTTTGNWTGDATLSLLLDPAGNLRLRAFTRTINRFDMNQGSQETGLGITYRENFDNFKDLKRIFRERFANLRKRREQRRKVRARQRLALPAEQTADPDSEAGAPSDPDQAGETVSPQ